MDKFNFKQFSYKHFVSIFNFEHNLTLSIINFEQTSIILRLL